MNDYGISVGKLFFVGLVSVVLITVLVVGLEALYYWQVCRLEEASEESYRPWPKLEAATEAQQKRLTDYAVVDAKKGIVSIPVGRAKQLVLDAWTLGPAGGAE